MTKWTGLIFLIIPAVLSLINILRQNTLKEIFGNILVGGMIFLILVLPWYSINSKDIAYLGSIYSVDHSKPEALDLFNLNDYLDYLKIFIRDQFSPIPAAIFFVSTIFLAISNIKKKWFIISMFFVNLLFFSFLGNKDARFTMHLLVFSSLAIVLTFREIFSYSKILGVFFFSLLVTFFFGYFFILTFRPIYLEGFKSSINTPILGQFHLVDISNDLVEKYDFNNWSLDILINDLKEINNQDNMKLLVVSEWRHFNPSNIRLYSRILGVNNWQITTADPVSLKNSYGRYQFPNYKELESYLRGIDYILIAINGVGLPILLNGKALTQIYNYINPENYPECQYFQGNILPAKSFCVVRKGEILKTTSDVEIEEFSHPSSEPITGFAKVYCKWGCSFEVISIKEEERLKFNLIKTYILPNGEIVELIKVN